MQSRYRAAVARHQQSGEARTVPWVVTLWPHGTTTLPQSSTMVHAAAKLDAVTMDTPIIVMMLMVMMLPLVHHSDVRHHHLGLIPK